MKNPLAPGAFRQFFARRRMFDAIDARQIKSMEPTPPTPETMRRLHAINAMVLDGNHETAAACLKILRQ